MYNCYCIYVRLSIEQTAVMVKTIKGGKRMDKKVVVLDLDSVVVNFDDALERHMWSLGYEHFTSNRCLTYDYNKTLEKPPKWLEDSTVCGDYFLNANRAAIFAEFENVEFFEKIKVYQGLEERIRRLKDKYDIHFHTCANSRAVAEQKLSFIEKVFKGVNYRMSVTLGGFKPAFSDTFIVVEDCIGALRQYKGMSTQRILVDKPYNQLEHNQNIAEDFDGVTRVNSLSDYIDYLLA